MNLASKTYQEIDKGMRNIIKKLYNKNYLTRACCEGHGEDWESYILFAHNYDFDSLPPLNNKYEQTVHKKANNNGMTMRWKGQGEKDRINLLTDLDKWAKSLPKREIIEEKFYTLMAFDTKKNFMTTLYAGNTKGDYKEIIEKKNKRNRYKDFKENETVIRRY